MAVPKARLLDNVLPQTHYIPRVEVYQLFLHQEEYDETQTE